MCRLQARLTTIEDELIQVQATSPLNFPARLREKLARVQEIRREGTPTVPSTIAEEKETNPFLRTGSPELAASVRRLVPDLPAGDFVDLFAAVRRLKDNY